MAKFLDNKKLANRFVLKLKLCKNLRCHFSIDILLMVMESPDFSKHPGQHSHMNTTRGEGEGFRSVEVAFA